MNDATLCPRCGSDDTRRRPGLLSTGWVCCACRKRFSPPVGGKIVALVFAVPGVLFSIAAVVIGYTVTQHAPASARNTNEGFLCSSIVAMPGLVFFALAIRELLKRPKEIPAARPREDLHEPLAAPAHVLPVRLPGLVAREKAEGIVRELAEHYGLRGVVKKLGNFQERHLANARAAFADQMGDDETPLAFVDRSLLGNGKVGFLVTNRGLYSSCYPHVLWLKDIHVVSHKGPTLIDHIVCFTLIVLGNVFCLPVAILYLVLRGVDTLHDRLSVNGEVVYKNGKFGTPDFWIDVLTTLGEAARRQPLPVLPRKADPGGTGIFRPDAARLPMSVVLATVHAATEGQPPEVRRFSDPTSEHIEQAIRDLDARDRPSLRLSADVVLEIRGGNGKYTLRQPGDGWVYYDPSAGEEEVEVGTGERCPAFYVCTEILTVLRIARHFVETGGFE